MRRRRVIYLNWDGFAWDYYEAALRGRGDSFPGLRRLTREGTVFFQAYSGIPSLTVPMQTSLVTGAWPAAHQNTFRWFDRAAGVVRESGHRNDLETIAEAGWRQGRCIAAVNQFTLRERGTAPDDPGNPYVDAGPGCRRRFRAARRLWRRLRPDLLCLYCDDLDAAGHNFASGGILPGRIRTEEQRRRSVLRKLRRLDRHLAAWLAELSPAGPPDGVALALATDHGMTPYRGPSSLPVFLERLQALGIRGWVCGPGERPPAGDGVVIVTTGLQLQLYLTGALAGRTEEYAARLTQALRREPWFGGALGSADLLRRGAHPTFADLLVWPEPPHHFKSGSRNYPARGQHDTLDSTSAHVFLALWGEGIPSGQRVGAPVRLIDLAPTLAALLAMAPPRGSAGRILVEAREPADD